MKILVLSQYWRPENGVPQRRWAWFTEILARENVDVDVVAPPSHYMREESLREWIRNSRTRKATAIETGANGETIFRSAYFPSSHSLTSRAVNQAVVAGGIGLEVLRRFKREHRELPDVIVGTVPALPVAPITALVASALRIPYVIDLRDAWPDLLSEADSWNESTGRRSLREKILSKGPLQLLVRFTEAILRKVLREADGIIVTSSALEEELRTRYGLNKGSLRIATIRNVFPPETKFRRSTPDPRDSGTLRVIYAGTLGRAQHLQNAVKAAAIAKDNGIDIRLRFIGAGAARDSVSKLADSLGVDAEFVVRKPADALDDDYAWADTALVHLTDWDGLKRAVPSKTYELMEVGLHISGVIDGETAQLIRDQQAGDVVPPEDPEALAALWEDLARSPERLEMNTRASQWVASVREKEAPAALIQLLSAVSKKRTSDET